MCVWLQYTHFRSKFAREFKLYCILRMVIIINSHKVEPCVYIYRKYAIDTIHKYIRRRKKKRRQTNILNDLFCFIYYWNSKKIDDFHVHFPSSYYPIFVLLTNETTLYDIAIPTISVSHTHNLYLEHALYSHRLAFIERNTMKKNTTVYWKYRLTVLCVFVFICCATNLKELNCSPVAN